MIELAKYLRDSIHIILPLTEKEKKRGVEWIITEDAKDGAVWITATRKNGYGESVHNSSHS